MTSLKTTLNGFFSRTQVREMASTRYEVARGDQTAIVRKIGKLWTVTVDGRRLQNSMLGDLRLQLVDMGFSFRKLGKS